ncbi:MAG: SufE family protein, partial [Verrucomicrobia bacterium]|nr:SufE family protein [Verrucomicrobiota bacterium]
MATLDQKLAQLAAELALFADAQERLAFLVDRARRHPPLPAGERLESNRVHGCVSVVWLAGEIRAGCCHFRADADSPLVRGLVIFLAEFF